jgi:hypothetical protein
MHYYFDKILLFAKSGCYNNPIQKTFINSALYHAYFGPKLSCRISTSRRFCAMISATAPRN